MDNKQIIKDMVRFNFSDSCVRFTEYFLEHFDLELNLNESQFECFLFNNTPDNHFGVGVGERLWLNVDYEDNVSTVTVSGYYETDNDDIFDLSNDTDIPTLYKSVYDCIKKKTEYVNNKEKQVLIKCFQDTYADMTKWW